jgi:hypothetical protein
MILFHKEALEKIGIKIELLENDDSIELEENTSPLMKARLIAFGLILICVFYSKHL